MTSWNNEFNQFPQMWPSRVFSAANYSPAISKNKCGLGHVGRASTALLRKKLLKHMSKLMLCWGENIAAFQKFNLTSRHLYRSTFPCYKAHGRHGVPLQPRGWVRLCARHNPKIGFMQISFSACCHNFCLNILWKKTIYKTKSRVRGGRIVASGLAVTHTYLLPNQSADSLLVN